MKSLFMFIIFAALFVRCDNGEKKNEQHCVYEVYQHGVKIAEMKFATCAWESESFSEGTAWFKLKEQGAL